MGWYLYSSQGFRQSGTQTLVDRAVGNYRLQLLSDRIRLTAGGVNSDLVTAGFVGAKSINVSLTAGGVPEFFADHVSLGVGDTAVTPATGTDDLNMLGDGASPLLSACEAVVAYAAPLTVADLTLLDAYMDARITPRKQWPGGGLRYPDRGDPYTPALGDPMFLDNIRTARVTLADQTSGRLSNTPYQIESGTWALKEDATTGERYIECVVGGTISRRNVEAYGTWEITQQRAIKNSTLLYSLVAIKNTWNMPGNNGWYLRHRLNTENLALVRVTNGVPVTFVGQVDGIAFNAKYEFTVTRTSAGVWNVYIKGGVYTNWTTIISGTDNVHSSSAFSGISCAAGDRLFADRQFAGVVSPI